MIDNSFFEKKKYWMTVYKSERLSNRRGCDVDFSMAMPTASSDEFPMLSRIGYRDIGFSSAPPPTPSPPFLFFSLWVVLESSGASAPSARPWLITGGPLRTFPRRRRRRLRDIPEEEKKKPKKERELEPEWDSERERQRERERERKREAAARPVKPFHGRLPLPFCSWEPSSGGRSRAAASLVFSLSFLLATSFLFFSISVVRLLLLLLLLQSQKPGKTR